MGDMGLPEFLEDLNGTLQDLRAILIGKTRSFPSKTSAKPRGHGQVSWPDGFSAWWTSPWGSPRSSPAASPKHWNQVLQSTKNQKNMVCSATEIPDSWVFLKSWIIYNHTKRIELVTPLWFEPTATVTTIWPPSMEGLSLNMLRLLIESHGEARSRERSAENTRRCHEITWRQSRAPSFKSFFSSIPSVGNQELCLLETQRLTGSILPLRFSKSKPARD